MSDPHDSTVLRLPLNRVFALHIREHDETLLVRLVGYHDEDEVPETHVPPLPGIVEVKSPPYRRVVTDARRIP